MPGHPSLTLDQLTIVRRVEGDSVTLVLGGELDLESASALERELLDAERLVPRRVVLDLAELGFLDSTGIHLLIDAQQRAETDGHQLVLTRVPPHVERLFTLTGLMPRLTVE